MSPHKLLRPAVRVAVLGLTLAVLVGCELRVRQDRTITFSRDGQASFQHDTNGVFVTDPATGKPRQIYSLAADELAASPPVWDAAGKRMVFAVARSADGTQSRPTGDAPADGRRYATVPVRYTCWIYDPSGNGQPEKLFDAAARHVGYIAAGLVVAWHPDGQRLDFVDRYGEKQHQFCTFDLATRRAEPVRLPAAEHVALGTSPGCSHRFAVLGGAVGESGLWVEDGGTWWLVPDSAPQTANLEVLRRRLPRWSRDGKKLAFADGPTLRVCDTATRKTEVWFPSPAPAGEQPSASPHSLSDIHWHPDGTRIGLIDSNSLGLFTTSRLLSVGPNAPPREVISAPVVSFAGWNSSGTRMAFVTAEPLPYRDGVLWATLFVPNQNARTAVRVADADGGEPRKELVSGLRATFPCWSPSEDRLSVWLTVEPPYRLASGGSLGMRPGDPAALIDPETGKLDWLPVNGTEHAQIGHVDLRAGRLDAALRRFDDAAAALPQDTKADWMFFRAIALQKASRDAEAREALNRFEPPAPDERTRAMASLMGVADPRLREANVDMLRARHRFAAEAFVSLEMATEGIDFLRKEVAEAHSDTDRLSATVALCQLLLLADRKAEYAELVADELLPLAGKVLAATAAAPERERISNAVAWTVLPLAVSEFTVKVPDDVLRRVSEKAAAWKQRDDDADFACQLVLRACGRQLRDAAMTKAADARIATHPIRIRWQLTDGEVDLAFLARVRFAVLAQEALLEMFESEPAGRANR